MQKAFERRITSRVFTVVFVIVMALTFALTGCSSNNNSGSDESSAPAAEEQTPALITVTMTVSDIDGNSLFDGVVEVEQESTALDVLEASDVEYVIETGSYGPYVTAIDGISAGETTGWTYLVNDERPSVGASEQQVADGDTIAWEFTEW